jgi:hypothetical protein
MHHYYITPIIDVSAVRDEAQKRAFDKRDPEGSIIHHHAFDEMKEQACPKETYHERYEAHLGLVLRGR